MQKFKVGEEVIMTGDSGYYNKGDTGVVSYAEDDTYDGSMCYEVYFPAYGCKLWVQDGHIQLLSKLKQEAKAFKSLTMEEVEQVFNSLPGGLEGFCKGWGWYDFARGIELLSKQKNGVQDG